MMNVPVLSDGVVRLRPCATDDVAALAQIWLDPTIRARNTVPDPAEDAALEQVVGRAAKAAAGAA